MTAYDPRAERTQRHLNRWFATTTKQVLATDGIIGPKTTEAAKLFGEQSGGQDMAAALMGLPADGAVDSLQPITLDTFLDVLAVITPAWWGRYLSNLTVSEVELARQWGFQIRLIDNQGVRFHDPQRGWMQSAEDGAQHARDAVKAAERLGFYACGTPEDHATFSQPEIWLDIEQAPVPSVEYLTNWNIEIGKSGFVPCVYLPSPGAWPGHWHVLAKCPEFDRKWVAAYQRPAVRSGTIGYDTPHPAVANHFLITPDVDWQYIGNTIPFGRPGNDASGKPLHATAFVDFNRIAK